MSGEDVIGSDLPTMSAADEAAFAAEEAAAKGARTETKGHQRLAVEPDHDGTGDPNADPAPTPAVAAPAAPAAPTPPADDDVEGAVAATDGSKYVPVATHVQQRKALQGQVTDMKAALDKATATNEALMKALGERPGAAPPPAAPVAAVDPPKNPFDENTHPLEHERWERQQLAEQVKAINEASKTAREQQANERAISEAQGAYIGAHRKFTAANPEFDGAYKWLTNTWAKMQQRLGHTPEAALQLANQTEWQIVQAAVKANVHPSQVIWDMAKDAGYAPLAAAAAGAGAAAPAPPSPAKQIEIAQAGAAAAMSLSDASGGSAPQALTLSSVASMSKEEFDRKFSGPAGEEAFRKLAMPRKSSAAA